MTKAYYTQLADKIYPIYGVSSKEEAEKYSGGKQVIETNEAVYMNTATGSIGFASDWDDLSEVVEVLFDDNLECWATEL